MGLPKHVDTFIRNNLADIQDCFKPGAKVLLIVDNGDFTRALVCGDADFDRAVEVIRYFQKLDHEATGEAS